ncbi:hypothetical protein C0991_011514 [Blastosporella zonata]|nr:hypothetical protein C0991_011514 [Blastosporella zonata]
MSEPLHMQELDEDALLLPSSVESAQDAPANTTFVELGSIQTDPRISKETLLLKRTLRLNGYSDYAEWKSTGKGLNSMARVTDDGRIVISLDLAQNLPDLPKDYARDVEEFAVDEAEWKQYPNLNIVIMIVGSRGDVQPYVALGRCLLKDGHRVRIATHETFRAFVTDNELEFFDIGGNPQDLMSYMVKNPGLIPGFTSLTNGDIGRKRKMLAESAQLPTSIHPNLDIVAMPWSPTAAFQHPLVNIKKSNAGNDLTNYLSYAVADIFTWQGVGDIVNRLRTQSLGLAPLTMRTGPGLLDRLKVPWTYCMSPALVPKPRDWKNHIDVVGFYFLDLATNYKPADDLAAFLAAGEPPVYIGFGSVVVDDAAAMTSTCILCSTPIRTHGPEEMIFDATEQAGVRALVSAGWGGLGGVSVPSHIFILGNVPHDWLFDDERVSAVVHHGGAGTTAVGLAKGRPTVIVPFFGDQGFWGELPVIQRGAMIHKAGAGPEPIHHKKLDVDNLRDAIKFAVSAPAKEAARRMAEQIHSEDGVAKGVESFYRHLPLLNMRCDLDPSRLAVWWSTEHYLKLSAFAAQTLADMKLLDMDKLDVHSMPPSVFLLQYPPALIHLPTGSKDYDSNKPVSDPISGGADAIFWTITHYYASIVEIFQNPVNGIIHTTTAIPQGVVGIIASVHEGLYNAPKLYGSKVRQPGQVTGFVSGVKEAGRGLFYGYYDGITGLVREPVEGAKKDGFIGAIKGSARSFVNVTARPAAGIIGAVVHPFYGAWKSLQTSTGKGQVHQVRETRVSDGREAVRNSTASQRAEIYSKFKEAQRSTDQRQKKYKEIVEKAMRESEEISGRVQDQSGSGNTSASSSEVRLPEETGKKPSTTRRLPPPLPKRPSATQSIAPSVSSGSSTSVDDDAEFERDLELAKQLSLAEQRGYERGLASRDL